MFGEVTQDRRACRVQPRVAVGADAGILCVGDQLSAFVVRHPVAGRGLDQRQVVGADDPQRAPHREVFRQRAALIEVGVQIGDRELRQPRPQGQVGSGGISGVQTDDTGCDVRRGPSVCGEELAACEPGPPLGNCE